MKKAIIIFFMIFVLLFIFLFFFLLMNVDPTVGTEDYILAKPERSGSGRGSQPILIEDQNTFISGTAQMLVYKAQAHEKKGDIAGMLIALEEAESFDPGLDLFFDPDIWELACRSGIIGGMAEEVLDECDRALVEAIADGNAGSDLIDFYEGRGIARALAGDNQGAIDDLRFYVNNQEEADQAEIRELWIVMLSDGHYTSSFDGPATEEAVRWNRVCRIGSLMGLAPIVLPACEVAVEKANESQVASFRDSRGLARALTGDRNGAVEDFQFFVDSHGSEPDYAAHVQRLAWIEDLNNEVDAFDRATLQTLLDE